MKDRNPEGNIYTIMEASGHLAKAQKTWHRLAMHTTTRVQAVVSVGTDQQRYHGRFFDQRSVEHGVKAEVTECLA